MRRCMKNDMSILYREEDESPLLCCFAEPSGWMSMIDRDVIEYF